MRDALLGSGWRAARFTRISTPILHYFRLQQTMLRLKGVAASTSMMNFMNRGVGILGRCFKPGLHLEGRLLVAQKSREFMTWLIRVSLAITMKCNVIKFELRRF